jgi:hypothetical protein
VSLGVIVAAIIVFFLVRRRRFRKQQAGKIEETHEVEGSSQPTTNHDPKAPLATYRHEAPMDVVAHEMATKTDPQELPAETWR